MKWREWQGWNVIAHEVRKVMDFLAFYYMVVIYDLNQMKKTNTICNQNMKFES